MSWGPLPLTLIRSTCTTSTTSSFWWTSSTTSPTTCVTVSRVQVWWSDWFSRDCEPEPQNCTASGFVPVSSRTWTSDLLTGRSFCPFVAADTELNFPPSDLWRQSSGCEILWHVGSCCCSPPWLYRRWIGAALRPGDLWPNPPLLPRVLDDTRWSCWEVFGHLHQDFWRTRPRGLMSLNKFLI